MTARDTPREEALAFLRFLAVGGAFALGYALAVSALVNGAGAPPWGTSVTVWILCVPLAFLAQKRITFRVERPRRAAFAIYAATQVASLALVSTVTTRLVTGSFLPDALVFLATAGTAAALSFAVSRLLAFRPAA